MDRCPVRLRHRRVGARSGADLSINPKDRTCTVGGVIRYTHVVKREAKMELQLAPREETEESQGSVRLNVRDEQDRRVRHLPASGLACRSAEFDCLDKLNVKDRDLAPRRDNQARAIPEAGIIVLP